MDWLEATVPFVRGIHMAAVLSIFGALVFRFLIAPRSLAQAGPDAVLLVRQGLARCFWASIAVAIVSGFGWLIFEAAMFTEQTTVSAVTLSLAPVAFDTRFGNLLTLRISTLVLCALLFGHGTHRGRLAIATVLAGGSVAVQAGIGHAGAIGGAEGAWLMTSEVLHLLAAGAWLGGLTPLLITISRVPPSAAGAAATDFSPVGVICVLLLAGTAFFQATELIGSLAALVSTEYGRVALLKLSAFPVLLTLAAGNRFVFTARVSGAPGHDTCSPLLLSIAVETALGLLVVLAASWLASLAPGIDEQAT